MQYITSALGLLSRLSLFVVFTPVLAVWFFVWMVIATGFAMFAWLIVIIILSDVPMGEALWHWVLFWPMTITGWIIGASDWSNRTGIKLWGRRPSDSHGSARFATRKERAAFEGGDGLLIGRDLDTGKLLRYDGPAHLLTLAPTRAGKGVGTVIPNLLLAERSVLVIDPKGENAKIAGEARKRFGAVHILDPFGVTGMPASAYNPLGRLDAESPDLGEDAASLAEALVMDPPGQQSEAHWNEEAKALLAGLIMFAVAHEDQTRKTLATVREYLTLPPEKFRALLELMQDSDAAGGLIARAANRFLGKSDREAASVMSSAQRHTHFLDSPRIVAATVVSLRLPVLSLAA